MSGRRKCIYSIAVPPWVAGVVVCGILVATAGVILFLYLWREKRRAKSFYGKVLEFSTMEQAPDYKKKEELESLVFGGQQNDVLVVNDPHNTPNGTGVKILMRKRIRKQTPCNPYGTAYTPAETSIIAGGPTPSEIQFTVVIDRLGRAIELIDCLKLNPPPTDSHTKMAEFICSEIRERLQTMTGRRYTVHGLVNEQLCIVKGHEHLFVDLGNTILQMKLVVKKPVYLKILAHEIVIVLDKLDATMVTTAKTTTMRINELEINNVDQTPTYFSAPQQSIVKKSGSNKNAQTPHQKTKTPAPMNKTPAPTTKTPAATILAVATPTFVTPRAKTNKASRKSTKIQPTVIEFASSSSQLSTPVGSVQQNNASPSGISRDIQVQQPDKPDVVRGPAVSRSSNDPAKRAPTTATSRMKSDPLQRTSRRSRSPIRALRTPGRKSDPLGSQEKLKGLKSTASPRPRLPSGSRAVHSNKRSNVPETPR